MMFSSKSEYGVRVMVELARRAGGRGPEQHERGAGVGELRTRGGGELDPEGSEAGSGEGAVVSLAEIAERNQMPLAYLEHLVARLRKAGLVDSRRGARGGYLLARPAHQITMAEIVEALEGSIAPMECISMAPDGTIVCSRESDPAQACPTKLLWTRVRLSIVRTLMETTLGDLIAALAQPIPMTEIRSSVPESAPSVSSPDATTAKRTSLARAGAGGQALTSGA
jgi:Rrf2 family protein